MEEMLNQVDINHAALEELEQLPGIKPDVAARIVEGRPYARVEELRRVNGIGKMTLEKLRALIVAGPTVEQPAEQNVEPAAASLEALAEAIPAEPAAGRVESAAEEPIVAPAPEPPEELPLEASPQGPKTEVPVAGDSQQAPSTEVDPWLKLPAVSNRPLELREALTYGLLGALAILILGVLLNLGILAAINRGLGYARSTEFSELRQQVDEMNSQATKLYSEVTVLRGRVDNIEAISGRVSVLEEETGSLQADLQAAEQQIEGFQSRIDELNNRAAALETRVGLFERFLSGLRDLMDQTLPQPAE